MAVSDSIAAKLQRYAPLPPVNLGNGKYQCRENANPYLFARNLAATRQYPGPSVVLEPFYMNNPWTAERISAGDYDGVRRIAGGHYRSIFRDYEDAISEALIETYSKWSVPAPGLLFVSGVTVRGALRGLRWANAHDGVKIAELDARIVAMSCVRVLLQSTLAMILAWPVPLLFADEVVEISDVGLGWAAHKTSPPMLVTADDHQYIAYYDDARRLTLAWRRLDEGGWRQRKFPVVTRWATGAHALIALTVDADGIIHLIPYRRDLSESPTSPPDIIYYRSARKHDPGSMERSFMVTPDEPHPHYPVFLKAADGSLFFESRIGSSGKGNQTLYRHDRKTGEWEKVSTLLDGQGRMSAYGGPRLGPDGRWHCLWMWRDTPDAATNHTLSYMVSPDLQNWTNAAGEPLELPIHPEHPKVVVDAARPGDGMINPLKSLGFDNRQRPIATYHRYAPCGSSAIYNARFEGGAWKSVAAHVWNFRWDFGGNGAVGMQIGCGPVKARSDGRLVQRVWSEREGTLYLTVDEETLAPVGAMDDAMVADDSRARTWQRKFGKPEVDFKDRPLLVSWLEGQAASAENGIRYLIRWEHGPVNIGDRAVPKPWPPGAPLRVFKVLRRATGGGKP